jgi:hypothetical protein
MCGAGWSVGRLLSAKRIASLWLSPPCLLSCPLHRLLRSLVSLKQVTINAAHYLVLGDKETYHFDPEAPFLQMVGPPPGSAWCV